jgi:hypothetical protein
MVTPHMKKLIFNSQFKINFMKTLFAILLVSLISNTGAFSQVRENKLQMSLGLQNALTVTIPDVEAKVIEKMWKNYTRNYGKITKNKKADEQMLEAVAIPTIYGDNKMDIYFIIENYALTAFFDLKTIFLNSTDNPKEYAGAKDFLQQFSFTVQRDLAKEDLEKEQDLLKKLNKKMADLIKDNKNYHEDIDDARAKIKKAENNIISNEKDQESMKAQISTQSRAVESVQSRLNKIGKID